MERKKALSKETIELPGFPSFSSSVLSSSTSSNSISAFPTTNSSQFERPFGTILSRSNSSSNAHMAAISLSVPFSSSSSSSISSYSNSISNPKQSLVVENTATSTSSIAASTSNDIASLDGRTMSNAAKLFLPPTIIRNQYKSSENESSHATTISDFGSSANSLSTFQDQIPRRRGTLTVQQQRHSNNPVPKNDDISNNENSIKSSSLPFQTIEIIQIEDKETKPFLRSSSGNIEISPEKLQMLEERRLTPLIALLVNKDDVIREKAAFLIRLIRISEEEEVILGDKGYGILRDFILHKNIEIQEGGIKSLVVLAETTKEGQIKILREVGYSNIINLLSSSKIEIKHAVPTLLGQLALTASNRKEIVKAGGIRYLIDLVLPLQSLSDLEQGELKLVRKVANALANLLVEAHHVVHVSEKGLGMIVQWLCSKDGDSKLLRGAAICIANISNTDDNQIKKKLVDLGVLDALISLLSSEKDMEILKGVAMAIANLTTQKKIRQIFCEQFNEDFLKSLIYLGNSSKDLEVLLGVAMTINNLVTTVPEELIRKGAPSLLKSLVKLSDLDIQQEANEALAVLLPEEFSFHRPPSFIRESDSISRSKMIKFVTDDDLQSLLVQISTENITTDTKEAAKGLRELSTRVENSKRLIRLGGVKPLMNLLQTSLTSNSKPDIDLIIDVLKILKGFLQEGYKAPTQSDFRKSGIMELCVELLKRNLHETISGFSLDIITDMTSDNVLNKLAMRNHVPILALLLKTHSSIKIKKKAARSLGALATKNRKLQKAVRKAGAIPDIVACLLQTGFPELVKNAVGALASIVEDDPHNQDRARKDGAIRIIVRLLKESNDDEMSCLCAVAGRALVTGCFERNQSEFRKSNVFSILVQLLSSKNEQLICYVAAFLLELSKDNNNNQESLVYAGAVPALLKAADTVSNPTALFSLEGVIYVCSRGSAKRRAAFRNANSQEVIGKLMKSENENVKLGAKKVWSLLYCK